MISKAIQITLGLMFVACDLQADSPYILIGHGDPSYSMSNLPKPLPPPDTLDKDADGTCLAWTTYWSPSVYQDKDVGQAPTPAWQVLDDLVEFDGTNPYNTGRAWLDLSFKFLVDRVVTDDVNLDSEGFLINPQLLITKGVIAPTITVEFSAIQYFHGNGVVKTWCGEGEFAKYKLVSVNGKKVWAEPPVGDISGWDWRFPVNHFTTEKLQIPVEMVKFPHKAPIGASPKPVENHLEVTTDMWGNDWAIPGIQLAWVKTSVKAMAPIFLVHGTNATPDTWNEPRAVDINPTNFNNYFTGIINLPPYNSFCKIGPFFYGLCFNDIELKPNGPIDGNGTTLGQQITDRLNSVGAKTCHIIAHSKGGLDSRAFLKQHYDSGKSEKMNISGHYRVLSLYTLDTPHRGTVLSDIAWYTLNRVSVVADPRWEDLKCLIYEDFPFLHRNPVDDPDRKTWLPTGDALSAQRTKNMSDWNDINTFNFNNNDILFYNTASDADWHFRNLLIDETERDSSGVPTNRMATSMYHMLYWAREIKARPTFRNVDDMGGKTIQVPVTELYIPPGPVVNEWNDLVVSIESAKYDGGILFCPPGFTNSNGILYKNHSNGKNYEMAAAIVDRIRLDWPISLWQ
jgi:hypothetical protein